MKVILNRDQLNQILTGSALLGSGGGGSIATGKKFISLILQQPYPVELTNTAMNGMGCVVADIGAVTAIEAQQERAIYNAFEQLDQYCRKTFGKKISCVLPIETGPENTFAPIVLAAKKKLPVFDGDGAGRAVPQIQLCSFASSGIKPSPAAIANAEADSLLIFSNDPGGMDSLLRPITGADAFGNSASMAFFPADIKKLTAGCVKQSISFQMYTGLVLQQKKKKTAEYQDAVYHINQRRSVLLCTGKVISVQDKVQGAFDIGSVVMKTTKRERITIYTQNENLIAFSDQQPFPLAVAPHSICFLDIKGRPLTNAEIKINDQVHLICVQAVAQLLAADVMKGFQQLLTGLGFAGQAGYVHLESEWKGVGELLEELLQ